MFVGHYSVSLAAKRYSPQTSAGWLFLAVQLLDVIWAPFVLLGIEKARIVPGFLPASSLDLYYMPWTHSLVMAFAWSWVAFRVSKNKVIGVCVFSHWLLDLVVHQRDLPIYKGAPYAGFGLWRSQAGTFWTEAVLLGAGLWVYMGRSKPRNAIGRFGMPLFVVLLIALNWANLYGPPPNNIRMVAVMGEICYVAFALVAGWLDRYRETQAVGAIGS